MSTIVSITTAGPARVEPLPEGHNEEALSFLGERPLHTVIMAGLLSEHGPKVPTPQGAFYSCHAPAGQLEGVALVGRATMFEARTSTALAAFAELTRETASVQMIMGEEAELKEFLSYYALDHWSPRLYCREWLYHFTRSDGETEGVAGLEQATLDHLNEIVSAHAEMVTEETGLNPLETDPQGFRRRCASRVAEGKVWALIEKGELIFKADVITETPQASYLEGVWVNPRRRHSGYGRRCWAELSRVLLDRRPSLCGFFNAENSVAHYFCERVGGTLLDSYGKVYL
jgi:hypothetical protein